MKNQLETLRKHRGLRQEDLAEILGVTRQTIGSIEKGRFCPALPLAFRIARFFGLPIEEIFFYEEESSC